MCRGHTLTTPNCGVPARSRIPTITTCVATAPYGIAVHFLAARSDDLRQPRGARGSRERRCLRRVCGAEPPDAGSLVTRQERNNRNWCLPTSSDAAFLLDRYRSKYPLGGAEERVRLGAAAHRSLPAPRSLVSARKAVCLTGADADGRWLTAHLQDSALTRGWTNREHRE